jgi:hypothetical protein
VLKKIIELVICISLITAHIGCSSGDSRQIKTVEDIVEQSKQEYNIIAPSLLQSADNLINNSQDRGSKYKGIPNIVYDVENRFEVGDKENAYVTIQAIETIYSYGSPNIVDVRRTISAMYPIEGLISYKLTIYRRESQTMKYIFKENEYDNLRRVFESAKNYPLPLPPIPIDLHKDFPKGAQEIAKKAKKDCLEAKQIKTVEDHLVWFVYSAKEMKWIPQSGRHNNRLHRAGGAFAPSRS